MSEWNCMEALKRTAVLKEGHFLLSSGRHSGQYMQCAQLLKYPKEGEEAGRALANLFADIEVDIVVGPALGGVIIAYEVARALEVPNLFTERKDGKMELRRGFSIPPNERVLIIEDVVTTGGSVREVIQLLEERDANIVGIGSIVDRSNGNVAFKYPYRSFITMEVKSYEKEACPLCKKGLPVVKPGSREKVVT